MCLIRERKTISLYCLKTLLWLNVGFLTSAPQMTLNNPEAFCLPTLTCSSLIIKSALFFPSDFTKNHTVAEGESLFIKYFNLMLHTIKLASCNLPIESKQNKQLLHWINFCSFKLNLKISETVNYKI